MAWPPPRPGSAPEAIPAWAWVRLEAHRGIPGALERWQTGQARGDYPRQLPAWFWEWAEWRNRVDAGPPAPAPPLPPPAPPPTPAPPAPAPQPDRCGPRPAGAPDAIPGWAWVRLEAHRGVEGALARWRTGQAAGEHPQSLPAWFWEWAAWRDCMDEVPHLPPPAVEPDPPNGTPELELDVSAELEAGPEPTAADWEQAELRALEWEQGISNVVSGGEATAGQGDLIGYPGQGTHSWTEPPNNWQSDNAVDVSLHAGTRIEAVRAGKVSTVYGYGLMAGSGRFAGYRLHVEHPGGMVSFYHHLRSLVARPGQQVAAGELLGYSGIANGVPHLHFAVTPPFNPQAFYRDAFNNRGREPYRPGPTPATPKPTPAPAPKVTHAAASEGWHRIGLAFGYTWPAATRNVRELRQSILRSVRL